MSGENRTPGDHQLSSIQIPDELKEHYKVLTGVGAGEERVLNLKGLSRVNLFVGPNNSGKSRFLRGVAAAKGLKFRPKTVTAAMETVKTYLNQEYLKLLKHGPFREVDPFAEKLAGLPDYNSLQEGNRIFSPTNELISVLKEANRNSIALRDSGGGNYPFAEQYVDRIRTIGRGAEEIMGILRPLGSNKLGLRRLYIPTLRGLRPPVPGQKADHYAERVKKDYFAKIGKDLEVEIYTGLTLYDHLQTLLLGDRLQREWVREYEEFLEAHLFGSKVELVPRRGRNESGDYDVVFVKIGREKERPIYELGDGVQNVIILTFPIFSHQDKPTLVFIEEPELFLHPGMQRTLLKAMMRFPDHQYFVATHSNHLLDLAMEPEFDDVSIFKMRKETGAEEGAEDVTAKFTVELAVAHDHHLLEMLGARVSSVFLSNCTIWVEGITDRLYFAKYLELYCDHLEKESKGRNDAAKPFRPRQDYHFSFVEYSGGNITHWSFLDDDEQAMQADRLCAQMMLIADKDDARAKDERHQKLEAKLGERFYRLNCREVENLLTPEVIKAVVKSYEGDAYEDVQFKQDDYRQQGLGTFIMKKWTDPKRKGGYEEKSATGGPKASSSRTIKQKEAFCDRALNEMADFNALSEAAQALAVEMHKFISNHNLPGRRA